MEEETGAISGLTASVIVLAHNDKKYLDACLSSLLDQDMPSEDYEVIYADNASSDGSVEWVSQHYPSVRIVKLPKNLGFAEGNNQAAEFAQGRFISFQNADTVAHRRWLPELIHAIQDNPEVKACHPAGLPLNFGGHNEREAPQKIGVMCELTRFGYVDFTEADLESEPSETLFIAGGSLLLDSEIFDALKYYFDPKYFIYNEDTDLGLRINNLGHKILFVPSALSYHQRDPSRRTLLNRKGLRMAYLVTRNRFITFFKNMHTLEFLLVLPLLCMGSIIKLRTMPLSLFKRLSYTLGLIPYTAFALGMAILQFPKYIEARHYILNSSPRGRFWLLSELWKRKVPHRSPLVDGVMPDRTSLEVQRMSTVG